MPKDPREVPRDGDDVEGRLRRALAEHADQAPPAGLVEQRILAAARRGDARSRRPRWLSVTSLRPVAVAASVLIVVGATLGGVALVHGFDDSSHAGASRSTTSSAPVSDSAPSSVTSSSPPVSSPPPVTGASESATNATPSTPKTGRVPAGFTVSDLTFVGTKDGWALGTAPCSHKPCTSLVRTTDGGLSWVGLGPPVVGLVGVDSCTTAACVSGVRFASKQVGYLFGPRIIYLTTDGGATWSRVTGGAEGLEIADGTVLRVTTTTPGCAPGCQYLVQSSAVGSTRWRTVYTTAQTGGVSVGLARAGRHAYVQVYGHVAGGAQSAHAALYASSDDGAHWSARGEPCPQIDGASAEYDASSLTPTPAGAVVVLCAARATGPNPFLATSSEGGAHFAAGTPAPGLSAPIGAASATVVFAQSGIGAKSLLRSSDGGKTFTAVARANSSVGADAAPGFLGFENATTGRWVSAGDPSSVWTTTDAGVHWTAHTFP